MSFCSLSPVILRSKGTLTLPCNDKAKFGQTSLGPMNYSGLQAILPSSRALIEAVQEERDHVRGAIYFFGQAVNSDDAFFRFVNLSTACEMIIAAETPVEGGGVHPRCPNCQWELAACPKCEEEWPRISQTLRKRASFLFSDEGLLGRYIKARNTVAHPASGRITEEFRESLRP